MAQLARVYDQLGEVDQAVELYQKALKLNAYHPVVLNNLVFMLGQQGRSLKEAADLAERAYRLVPGNAQIADTVGWIEYQRGNLDRAQTVLTKAVTMGLDDPRLRYHLGKTCLVQEQTDCARTELAAALKLGPFPEAAEAQTLLQTLP